MMENKYTNADIANEFRIFGFLAMKYNIDCACVVIGIFYANFRCSV